SAGKYKMSFQYNKRKLDRTISEKVNNVLTEFQPSYVSYLPPELLGLLFLYFDPSELLYTLPQIEQLRDFERLFKLEAFWKELWYRDISSVVPSESYRKYLEVLNYMN